MPSDPMKDNGNGQASRREVQLCVMLSRPDGAVDDATVGVGAVPAVPGAEQADDHDLHDWDDEATGGEAAGQDREDHGDRDPEQRSGLVAATRFAPRQSGAG